MVFSSLLFLFIYLPVALIVYYSTPDRFRNGVLLFLNLVFYGWGEPSSVFLMLVSIWVDYALGRLITIQKKRGKSGKEMVVCSCIWNLGLLVFFKYLGLAVLPIGISFYTFQKLSYVIDVYRMECDSQNNFVDFAVYVTLFPQLIAGPIVQYKDLKQQLSGRKYSFHDMREGIRIFTVGLCKKVLIANNAGELFSQYAAKSGSLLTMPGAWLGLLAFCFQIYFDFSGYSDMAAGLGRMLGFTFPENFEYPYTAKSLTDFWRRWHKTLSGWFREYLYIPLGGNRKGKGKTIRNLLIVWMATGIWHGAGWNFLLWGFYYGVLLVAEKFFLLKSLKRLPGFWQHVYALLLIAIGWAIFVVPDMADPAGYFKALFGGQGLAWTEADRFWLHSYTGVFMAAIFASLPVGKKLYYKQTKKRCSIVKDMLETVWILAGLGVSVAYLVDATYNPFLYFRF